MKQKQKCSSCGQDYFVTMLKIYVFKKHTCPDDKTELMKSIDGNVFSCPKCKKIFRKTVPVEWNSMGTKIEGSTRSFEEKEKRLIKEQNTEVENVMIPEESMCQKCRNWQTRSEQATKNRERKIAMGVPDDIKVVPDSISNADIYRYEIFRKTQTDYQETRKAEAYEQQKKERAIMEAERLATQQLRKPEDMLPTKEEIIPLIDAETAKIMEEIKKKDAHIAELKKKMEESKKVEK
jgi:ribosomal protein L37AE/L43A